MSLSVFFNLISASNASEKSPIEKLDQINKPHQTPCSDCDNEAVLNRLEEQEIWAEGGFEGSYIQAVDLYDNMSGTAFTHKVPLDVVILRGTNWNEKNVTIRYKQTAKIFSQCQIKLEPVRFVYASLEDRVRDLQCDPESKDKNSMFTIAKGVPKQNHLTTIHFGEFDCGETGTSGPELRYGSQSPLLNKAWLSQESLNLIYDGVSKGYIPEAHELGHLLLNAGHVKLESPNLMHGPGTKSRLSTDLDKETQCKKAQKHPYVKKISKAAK